LPEADSGLATVSDSVHQEGTSQVQRIASFPKVTVINDGLGVCSHVGSRLLADVAAAAGVGEAFDMCLPGGPPCDHRKSLLTTGNAYSRVRAQPTVTGQVTGRFGPRPGYGISQGGAFSARVRNTSSLQRSRVPGGGIPCCEAPGPSLATPMVQRAKYDTRSLIRADQC
jgi:hypothetical protein